MLNNTRLRFVCTEYHKRLLNLGISKVFNSKRQKFRHIPKLPVSIILESLSSVLNESLVQVNEVFLL